MPFPYIHTEGELVRWNENGDKFAVLCDRELRLYRVVSDSILGPFHYMYLYFAGHA